MSRNTGRSNFPDVRIVVSGMGVISSLGNSLEENRSALRQGRSGIGKLELFPTRYAGQIPVAEIKISTEDLGERLSVSEKGITRTSLLALHACKEAIASARLSKKILSQSRTALIGANTVGGMCLTDELYHDANSHDRGSEYLSSYDAGSVTLFLREYFGINGICNTINTACSSSANAIMFGARLIKNGLADRVIAGGVDSLAKFTVNGFNALHILSPEPCKPFDRDRKGLNLGEGAAFLVLEREGLAGSPEPLAEISGYSNTNDAYHPSSLSDQGEGPALAMKVALDSAGLLPEDIDYINVHGTATENNDIVESRAMLNVFGNVPLFSSTKSNTGHTLGAAGAIEAAYAILSLKYGEVYPHLRFGLPLEETGLIPVATYLKKELKHVMSNSFGFGGNCSSLVFSRV